MIDDENFLTNINNWSPDIAKKFFISEKILPNLAHWEIIQSAQNFYQKFNLLLEIRPFIVYIKNQLGKKKINTVYILKLFPNSPIKNISKIAGLPKPINCL